MALGYDKAGLRGMGALIENRFCVLQRVLEGAVAQLKQALGSGFIRDAAWLGGSTLAAQAIGLLSLPLIAYLYSPADFGIFTIFVAALALASLLATFGFEHTIMTTRGLRAASLVIVVIVLISLTTAVFVGLSETLVGLFASKWRPPWDSTPWMVLFPIGIFALGIATGLRIWSMRRRRFRTVATGEIARAVVFVVVACGLGLGIIMDHEASAGSLCLAYTLAELARLGVLTAGCVRNDRTIFARPSFRRLSATARRNGRLAGTIFLNRTMQLGAYRLPHLVLGATFGATTVGLFAMAERLVAMPTQVVSTAVGNVFRQRAAELYLRHGDFSVLVRRTLLMMAGVALVPFIAAFVLAPWLFGRIFGAEWVQAGEIAQVLLVGEIFGFIINPISPTAVIISANRYLFFWALTRLLLVGGLVALVAAGKLTLIQFLWLIVCVRILMVSVEGTFCYFYSRAK